MFEEHETNLETIQSMKTTALALAASALSITLSPAATFSVGAGTTSVGLDTDLLATIGWSVTGASGTVTPAAGFDVGFDILPGSDFSYDDDPFAINGGSIFHSGTVELTSDGTSTPAGSVSVGNFTIDSSLSVIDTFTTGAALFSAGSPVVDADTPGQLQVTGDLLITDALSTTLVGNTSLTGTDAGDFRVDAVPEPSASILLGGAALALMARRRRSA